MFCLDPDKNCRFRETVGADGMVSFVNLVPLKEASIDLPS